MKLMLVCFCLAPLVLMLAACASEPADAPNTPAPAAQPQQEGPTRSIVNVTEDLYRAQNNVHYTVFLVTPEGIIMSDPINRDFATWLRGEMEARFDVPVRYVLYSHSHLDHVSGGEVFADTAEFIAHENLPDALAALRQPDSDVHPPTDTYSDRTTIMLGGESVEMIHPGTTHAVDMSILRFPGESAVFVVDFVSLVQVPWQTISNNDVEAWVESIRFVENIGAEIVVPAHGQVGTTADIAELRRYVEEMRDAVAAGIEAGSSLEELQESITMDAYSDWEYFEDWRTLNIEGMYLLANGTHPLQNQEP